MALQLTQVRATLRRPENDRMIAVSALNSSSNGQDVKTSDELTLSSPDSAYTPEQTTNSSIQNGDNSIVFLFYKRKAQQRNQLSRPPRHEQKHKHIQKRERVTVRLKERKNTKEKTKKNIVTASDKSWKREKKQIVLPNGWWWGGWGLEEVKWEWDLGISQGPLLWYTPSGGVRVQINFVLFQFFFFILFSNLGGGTSLLGGNRLGPK